MMLSLMLRTIKATRRYTLHLGITTINNFRCIYEYRLSLVSQDLCLTSCVINSCRILQMNNRWNHASLANLLLEYGALPSIKNNLQLTPLQCAKVWIIYLQLS